MAKFVVAALALVISSLGYILLAWVEVLVTCVGMVWRVTMS